MRESRQTWLLTTSVGLLLTVSLVVCIRLSINALCLPDLFSTMACIPAGTFTLGNAGGHPDERPPHPVYLEAFYIDKHEVTNEQYLQFFQPGARQCGDHVCLDTRAQNADSHIVYQGGHYVVEAGYERHPVILVSWYGAQAYCQHRGKRLPTEAEWEKAARGPDGRTYPWGSILDPYRLNAGSRVGDTTPVGSYPDGRSPYGASDMAGNVWEWTGDWYQGYPPSSYHSPFFGTKYKVVRGGSWNHPYRDARTTQRDLAHPARRIRVVGFRCARDP